LLDNPAWCQEHPVQADNLRRTMTEALEATGQNLEPPPDERTPAQRLHDARMGVVPRSTDHYSDLPQEHRDFAAALSLPPDLARVIANELSGGNKADESEVSRLFGDKYQQMLKDAQFALDRAPGAKITARDLT